MSKTKERWVWICDHLHNASDWKDSEDCKATSRKTFPTKEKAEKALARHIKNAWHSNYIEKPSWSIWSIRALDKQCGIVKKLTSQAEWK